MLDLIRELFPICRSIAGDGLRETLRIVATRVPLTLHEVPTGTPAFDWAVPQEWSLRRATLRDPHGETIADTADTNLHVVNYSAPFVGWLSLDALQPHLHSMPDKPTVVPYRTSYYKPTWGFCLREDVRRSLTAGEYEASVDTTIRNGSLTYGEIFIPGRGNREILFSTHCCHPSLANDNLSAIAIAVELARWIAARDNALSYRFLFAPGTIGAITWLSRNVNVCDRIVAGLTLSCLGDAGGTLHFKRPRRESSLTEAAMLAALTEAGRPYDIRDFIPYGYDERQFCSPGFDLPIGCLMRSPHGEFAAYHTSADDVASLGEAELSESLDALKRFVAQAEALADRDFPATVDPAAAAGARYRNLNPHCEPQLGRRGLYAMTGGHAHAPTLQMALLWVLNYSDGRHGIDWIARRSKIDRAIVDRAVELLTQASLLERISA